MCHLREGLCVCVQLRQSCLTLCHPMDGSLSGSSVRGILQARILECVAIPFSKESSRPRDWTCLLRPLLCRQILYPLSYLGNPGEVFSSSRAGCVENIRPKEASPFCPTALPVVHVCLPGTSSSLKHSRKCEVWGPWDFTEWQWFTHTTEWLVSWINVVLLGPWLLEYLP